jgi:sugar lactone lactonase YvrE
VGSGAKGFHGDGGLAVQAKLNNPSGLAVDRDGNLYISEFVNNRIRRVDAKSKVITTIAGNGLPHRRDLMM